MNLLKDSIERYKSTLGILGLIFAGIIFVYKVADGWMSTNMDIAVEAKRSRYGPETDLLTVQVDLTKGEHSAIELLNGRARISFPLDSTSPPRLAKLYGLDRVSLVRNAPDWQSEARPYGVSPREKLQLATVFAVPSTAVVVIDVVIDAKAKLSFTRNTAQWRSATVSAPSENARDSLRTPPRSP